MWLFVFCAPQIAADVAHSLLLVAAQLNRTDVLPKWLLAHGDTGGMDGLHSGTALHCTNCLCCRTGRFD
jgi:hypothetical protein